MEKMFNVNGVCIPGLHYMVDLKDRLDAIKAMVDAGQYFAINKARQYGKTTTLRALAGYFKDDYIVISLDFQRMSTADFASESAFVNGLAREILRKVRRMERVSGQVKTELSELSENTNTKVRMVYVSDSGAAWTKAGVLEAVKHLICEKNPLFESLIEKLNDYPEMREMIYLLLFQGQTIAYNADDNAMDILLMFGFIRVEHETIQMANRIFETRLYNYFLTLPAVQNGEMYRLALRGKDQFIQNGQLDMEQILAKFVEHFNDIYGDRDRRFVDEEGRRYFLLYLKPIINGTGNYYVEARTRNQERTDLIIDYLGMQYIIEMKIWRGKAYNERGEKQLVEYLDHYHLQKGYMLSFSFNKTKETGLKEIRLGDKILIEAVV